MSNDCICKDTNFWRSEELRSKVGKLTLGIFEEKLEELRKISDFATHLSTDDKLIIHRLGAEYPLEFRLSEKQQAKLANMNDSDAKDLLFTLTDDEKDLWMKHYDVRGGLRADWAEKDAAAAKVKEKAKQNAEPTPVKNSSNAGGSNHSFTHGN